MDIKSKNTSKKIIVSVVALILVLLSTTLAIMSYSHIEKTIDNRNYSKIYFESNDFAHKLIESSYALYYKSVMEKAENKSKSPWDILSDGTMIKDDNENEDKKYQMSEDDIKNQFEHYLYRWNSDIEDKKSNLKYISKKIDENIQYTNIIGDINEQEYQCSLEAIFDGNGELSIQNEVGVDGNILKSNMDNIIKNQIIEGHTKLTTIKNMKFKFYIPENLEGKDSIYHGIRRDTDYIYYRIIVIITVGIIGTIILLGLITPFRLSRKLIGFNTFTKIPLEILFIILGITFGVLAVLDTIIMKLTVTGEVNLFLAEIPVDITLTSLQQYTINYILWFVIIGLALYYSVLVRHIFNYGFIKYLRDYTLIGRSINGVIQWIRRSVDYVIMADLNNEKAKPIMKVIVINGVILTFIALVRPWEISVIGMILYSIAIAVIIMKYVSKIKIEYNKLAEITNEIAKGNFDVNYEEDLGVFGAYKDSLEKIHVGFKKAVEEEVKSEKIKTELISNVSHDLKTPLTSIVTYVELLRNKDISDEERLQYLDVIDRKSERLKTLIEDLLEMSKVTSGNIELNLENINVVSLVKQAIFEFEDRFVENNLVVRKNFSDEKIMLNLDGERTFRVLENLISNISKYSMKNSRVYIEVIEKEQDVEIKLINMSAEEINFKPSDIMERFVRGDKSRNTEGSGLGLSIAKTFIELQGGKFELEIEGDLFKILLRFPK